VPSPTAACAPPRTVRPISFAAESRPMPVPQTIAPAASKIAASPSAPASRSTFM